MTKRVGFELLAKQASDAVYGRVTMWGSCIEGSESYGDSPIEKLFFMALMVVTEFGDNELPWRVKRCSPSGDDLFAAKADESAKSTLIIQRQIGVAGLGRVDFIIHAYADFARVDDGRNPTWRRLIVECDGHDFHEKTKEQVARDKSRDRAAALDGFEVFRFSGSELWRDPWGCASQVIEWANKGQ